MQYAKSVRKLLLEHDDVDENSRAALEEVFDYLAEAGDPEQKMKLLLFSLINGEIGGKSSARFQICKLPPELVPNLIKGLALCYADQLSLIPEIILKDFRVYDSRPTIYREDRGVHAMVIVTLLGLADGEAFVGSEGSFHESLMALLMEGLQKRYFRTSTIYSHQVSLLSSVLKVFVSRAHEMLPLSKARWNSLCHIITMSRLLFADGDDKKPGDASLEYALLDGLCFKLFNECSLETKASLLRSHSLSVAG